MRLPRRTPILSPLQQVRPVKKPAPQPVPRSAIDSVHEVLAEVMDLRRELEEELNRARTAVSNALQAQKGESGEKGEKGDKGESFFSEAEFVPYLEYMVGRVMENVPVPKDGKDGNHGKDAIVDYPAVAKMAAAYIKAPKDGKDGKIPTMEEIVDYLKENLTVEHIPGLRREIDSYRGQLAGKHYGQDTWARGGGDTVIPGSNITIVSNANGQKVISSTGGGGGSTTVETPTGTVNSSNTTFTPSQRPLWVVADGINYYEGAGYTYTGGNIVLDLAPSQYIRDVISNSLTVVTPAGNVDSSNTSFTVASEPKWVVADGITYYENAGYTYSAGTITMVIPPSQYVRAIL